MKTGSFQHPPLKLVLVLKHILDYLVSHILTPVCYSGNIPPSLNWKVVDYPEISACIFSNFSAQVACSDFLFINETYGNLAGQIGLFYFQVPMSTTSWTLNVTFDKIITSHSFYDAIKISCPASTLECSFQCQVLM